MKIGLLGNPGNECSHLHEAFRSNENVESHLFLPEISQGYNDPQSDGTYNFMNDETAHFSSWINARVPSRC